MSGPADQTHSCRWRCSAPKRSHRGQMKSSCCWCSLRTPSTAAESWDDWVAGTKDRLLPRSACLGGTVVFKGQQKKEPCWSFLFFLSPLLNLHDLQAKQCSDIREHWRAERDARPYVQRLMWYCAKCWMFANALPLTHAADTGVTTEKTPSAVHLTVHVSGWLNAQSLSSLSVTLTGLEL